MRVTTKMLNDSAQRAGLPINGNSLLNYVNGNNSEKNLLSALNKNKTGSTSALQKKNYEKVGNASGKLSESAADLVSKSENSVFAKADTEEGKEALYDKIADFVSGYNDTLKTLRSVAGTMENFYRNSLQEEAEQNSEALKAIGITLSKDGTMSLDKNKLKQVEPAELEKVLGKSGSFVSRVAFLAGRISDNAEANVKSISNQYTAAGSLSQTVGTGKYSFWG
ncbi:MAG: hypothetical protein K2I01_04255 [Lachnospiraceae bacterium]|nr:hypothetical protein [Lachnospiraceae bacterium]